MFGTQRFEIKDLILKVSPNVDPARFDLSKYEPFIRILTVGRDFQAEAIREVLRYLLGGEYSSLKELARENYDENQHLKQKYTTFDDFCSSLQLPDMLSCCVDLATAAGKSYVMYAIARIMLANGAVDRVLVLCPSNTIQDGLTQKFVSLSLRKDLRDALPSDSKISNPNIIHASNTIKSGDICIENIHATYERTRSSIEDSLVGNGQRTLILNDEAHHLASPSDVKLKEWKKFLLDPKYGFKYVVGFSGTCYTGNEYFADVIYRYSIKDAIDDKTVKDVAYVAEGATGPEAEKFQLIYKNHVENKKRYAKLKPLTIMVTKNISTCEELTEKWIEFLARKERITKSDAAKQVLIVTSSPKHQVNIPTLSLVDRSDNSVEWIASVSMLTEGWDVKNVFQIVPHEKRAFNSKLLIAQVLGRGLRIPEVYRSEGIQPTVTVFNHDKWSDDIKHLVSEVMESEKKIRSYPLEEKAAYNFSLHSIRYSSELKEQEPLAKIEIDLLKGIPLATQNGVVSHKIVFVDVGKEEKRKVAYTVETPMHDINEAASLIENRLAKNDRDTGENKSGEWPRDRIVQVLTASLATVPGGPHNKISDDNLQTILEAFGSIYQGQGKPLRYEIHPSDMVEINTHEMGSIGSDVASVGKSIMLFYDDLSMKKSHTADRTYLKELIQISKLSSLGQASERVKAALFHVKNKYQFKTPQNLIFAESDPERKFIENLLECSDKVAGWIKTPRGFYQIEYVIKDGQYSETAKFTPDFFILLGTKRGKPAKVVVPEVKMDGDVSDENVAKLIYARKHFDLINSKQHKQVYDFKFVSPESYPEFFEHLSKGTLDTFKSKLEAGLETRLKQTAGKTQS